MGYVRIKDKIEYTAYAIFFDLAQSLVYNNELDIYSLQGLFCSTQEFENNTEIRLWDDNGIDHGIVQIINQKEYRKDSFEYTILKEIDPVEYERQVLFLKPNTNESQRQAYANTFSTINSLLAISHLEQHLPMKVRHTNMKNFKCYGTKIEILLLGYTESISITILPFMRPIIFERLKRDMLIINQ